MPRAKTAKETTKPKKAAKKTTTKTEKISEPIFEEEVTSSENSSSRKFLSPKIIIPLLIVGGLLAFGYFNKGLFVAAMVNNQPITTLEVNKRMGQLYKERIVNQMVNETLLEQEASKKNITVSPDEIDARVKKQAEQYGGEETFNSLLSQQGLTQDEFKRQTRLQLLVEKLYAQEITPTEDDIKKFLEENKDSPEATEPAKFRETATEEIKQQKLSTVFSQKFQELKNNAKIQTF